MRRLDEFLRLLLEGNGAFSVEGLCIFSELLLLLLLSCGGRYLHVVGLLVLRGDQECRFEGEVIGRFSVEFNLNWRV